MKKCTNCGTENQDNRKWCKKCMKELSECSLPTAEENLTEAPKCETRTSRLSGSMGKKVFCGSDDVPTDQSTQDVHSGVDSENHHNTEKTPVPVGDPRYVEDDKTVNSKLSGSVGGKRYGGNESEAVQSPAAQENEPGWRNPDFSNEFKEDKKRHSTKRRKTSSQKLGIIAASAVVVLLTIGGYFGWNALISAYGNDIQIPGFTVSNGVTAKTDPKPSREEQALMEQFNVESIVTYQENGSLYLKTRVSLPDLSQHFLDIYVEVDNTTQDLEAFQKKLFERALEEAEESNNMINVELTLDLTKDYPGKTEWTQEELTQLALQAALNAEIEEFAMIIMQTLAPEWEVE